MQAERERKGRRGRTIDEEEVRTGILLSPAGKIADDAVDIGGGGHEHVDGVEARLCFAIVRYGFDDEDLPSRGGVDGADSVQKLCTRNVRDRGLAKKKRRTISDGGDEGGHAR